MLHKLIYVTYEFINSLDLSEIVIEISQKDDNSKILSGEIHTIHAPALLAASIIDFSILRCLGVLKIITKSLLEILPNLLAVANPPSE